MELSTTYCAASVGIGVTLAWICLVDLRTFRIPDAASLGLLLAGLAFSPWSILVSPGQSFFGAAAGYAVFAALGAAFHRYTGKDGLGLGDAKLLAAAGAWLGVFDLPILVASAATAALVFSLMAHRRKLAFGPWLSGAFWVIWLVRISA